MNGKENCGLWGLPLFLHPGRSYFIWISWKWYKSSHTPYNGSPSFGKPLTFRYFCNAQLKVWRSYYIWQTRTWTRGFESLLGEGTVREGHPYGPAPRKAGDPEVMKTMLPRRLWRKEEVKHWSVLKGFHLILYRKLNSPIKQPGLDIHWHMRPRPLPLLVNRGKTMPT